MVGEVRNLFVVAVGLVVAVVVMTTAFAVAAAGTELGLADVVKLIFDLWLSVALREIL